MLQRAKRNGNKPRAEHVEIMNFTRQLKGRKDSKISRQTPIRGLSLKSGVQKQAFGKKIDCERGTGLSRPYGLKNTGILETDE